MLLPWPLWLLVVCPGEGSLDGVRPELGQVCPALLFPAGNSAFGVSKVIPALASWFCVLRDTPLQPLRVPTTHGLC